MRLDSVHHSKALELRDVYIDKDLKVDSRRNSFFLVV